VADIYHCPACGTQLDDWDCPACQREIPAAEQRAEVTPAPGPRSIYSLPIFGWAWEGDGRDRNA
jgi:hypothetical protein